MARAAADFFGYDQVASGQRRGYTVWSMPNDEARIERPYFAGVNTEAKRDDCVRAIGEHMLRIIDDARQKSGRRVAEVQVGKSYVECARGRREFDPTGLLTWLTKDPTGLLTWLTEDPTDLLTWSMKGVRSRWNVKYNGLEYDGVVIVVCFSRGDVPRALSIMKFDHQDLCLKYEDMVAEWLRENVGQRTRVVNADDGGGGRRSKTHDGFVLYLAFKFAAN